MTAKNYSAPPGTCTFPGCDKPRHVSKYGRTYSRCTQHYHQEYRKTTGQKGAAIPKTSRPKRAPAPETVPIMVIDWASDRILHLVGIVSGEPQAFPQTYGQLLKTIAQASRQGVYIAYVRPYKEEDLHESA